MKCEESRDLLVAYSDGEVTPSERSSLQAHLLECAGCRGEMEAIVSLQDGLRRTLRTHACQVSPPAGAWERLQASIQATGRPRRRLALFPWVRAWTGRSSGAPQRGRDAARVDLGRDNCQNFEGGPCGGRRRLVMSAGIRVPRWLAVSVVTLVVFVAAFALVPPLRTAAQDPFGIFRVKRFTTITVDPSALPSAKPDPTAFGSLTIAQMPQVVTVSALAEAQSMVDFALRSPKNLPAGLGNPTKIAVTKEGRFSYTFDLAKTRDSLAMMGIPAVSLPAGLDGATVKLTIPAQVLVEYQAPGQTGGTSLILSQGHSPVIEAPPGLDVDALRRQLLALPGLPTELVSQLQSVEDWKQTVIIPLPKQGVVSKEVAVDGGMRGLYLEGKGGDEHALLWEKSGLVYGMAGTASADQLAAAANSMSP